MHARDRHPYGTCVQQGRAKPNAQAALLTVGRLATV